MKFSWKLNGDRWDYEVEPGFYRFELSIVPVENMLLLPPGTDPDDMAFLHVGEVPEDNPAAVTYKYSLWFPDYLHLLQAFDDAYTNTERTIEKTFLDIHDEGRRWTLRERPSVELDPMTPKLSELTTPVFMALWRLR